MGEITNPEMTPTGVLVQRIGSELGPIWLVTKRPRRKRATPAGPSIRKRFALRRLVIAVEPARRAHSLSLEFFKLVPSLGALVACRRCRLIRTLRSLGAGRDLVK